MFWFPKITHIDQIRAAIEGRDEFIIKEDHENGLLVCNYLVNFADTFEDPYGPCTDEAEALRRAIRRECRGIVFHMDTGELIARRYHKFFNVGERTETGLTRIDLNNRHWILEKLDGSMITPILTPRKGLRWGTKMGPTAVAMPVEKFVASHPEYAEFFEYHCVWGGKQERTPIFEWCSLKQKIVLDYPVDRLILTAVRINETGEYLTYDELQNVGRAFGIPVVKAFQGTVDNMESLVASTKELVNAEGWVLRFENGQMFKMKSDDYCRRHHAIDGLRFEKDVLALIVNESVDDVLPIVQDDVAKRLRVYNDSVLSGLRKSAGIFFWEAQAAYDNLNGSKKRFATEIAMLPKNRPNSGHLFKAWDFIDQGKTEDDVFKYMVEYVKRNANSQPKVDEIRYLWGKASWTTIEIDLDA